MADKEAFYVYAFYRDPECLGPPFYIGKGIGNRWRRSARHNRRHNLIKHNICTNLIALYGHVPCRKLYEGLTEGEAHDIEAVLIKRIGRHPYGSLVNLTDGGEGIVNPSAETRAKMSAVHKGKIVSAEVRAAQSLTRTGRKHPPGTGAKIAEANRRRVVTEQTKAKIRAANLGKTASDETKAKMSASQTGKKRSSESIARMIAAQNDPARLEQNRLNNLGRKRSPETREKMRQAALRRYGRHAAGASSSDGSLNGSPSPPGAGVPV